MEKKNTLIIFTRYPEPGLVKTRLVQALGENGAASLHCDMVMHALDTARRFACTDNADVEVHFSGRDAGFMRVLFGPDHCYVTQEGPDIGGRMCSSLSRVLRKGAAAAVLIGTDCPGVTEAVLRKAFHALEGCDCVIGPSKDGGYYLIGMKEIVPEIFSSIPWGTGDVLRRTMDEIARMGLKVSLVDRITDVDRPEDLYVWEEERHARTESMISVVIPAINEESGITGIMEKALMGKNIEVIVADGGSTDSTGELALRMGARVVAAGRGRALQMNEGAKAALGDILLFLHADTMLPQGFDRDIRNVLADPDTAAGAFRLCFERDAPTMQLMAFGANLRSRFLKLPYGDQAIFVRRDVFHAAGGFPEIPIMEDVAFMRAMHKRGRVVILPTRVSTSSRRFRRMGVFRTWLLNQLAMAWYFLDKPLDDLAFLYRSSEASLRIWLRRILGRKR